MRKTERLFSYMYSTAPRPNVDDSRNTPLVRYFQCSYYNWVVVSVGGLIMKHCVHPAVFWSMQRFIEPHKYEFTLSETEFYYLAWWTKICF